MPRPTSLITLQNVLTPEPGVCTEQALFHREHGVVGFSYDSGTYVMPRAARLSFDTYFNLFNLDSWRDCALDGLFIELCGSGEVEIQVIHVAPSHAQDVVHRRVTTLTPDQPHQLDMSALVGAAHGVIYFSLTAIGDRVTLSQARFATRSLSARALPALTVSITTFKREAAVQATVARLNTFLADFPFGDQIRVQVVDNGHSADIAPSDHVTPYTNPNLGGAGGFTRGLLEAEAAGASHCLFMDDDASFHMENIARTYMFLTLAQDPKTAVAGAMINSQKKWAIWENGAWFDGVCRPIAHDTDLRDPEALLQMQFDSVSPQPQTLYGGWWFFAFPIAQVRHHPFPFFVRGDDSSFSLANDFSICTLNGVVSFQDDFYAKETAQILYLDLRYHLVHHLVFDQLARSPLRTAWVGLRLMLRSLVRMHYASAQAQLLAMRDVMEGPEVFDRHIDMQERRRVIAKLAQAETWQPVQSHRPDTARNGRLRRLCKKLCRTVGLVTLNGHFVPFWSHIARHCDLDIARRGAVKHLLGATNVTFFNETRDHCYTVNHSKAQFFKSLWDMIRATWTFCRHYNQLKTSYRAGYAARTTRAYWYKTLDLVPPVQKTSQDQAAK